MFDVIVVGAGPAGLAAGYELTRHGRSALLLERLDALGGLCRTIDFAGCKFDVGPHRFFTQNNEVRQLFLDVVGEDVLRVQRSSRIFYRKRFFDYPLTPVNALLGTGTGTSLAILVSYLRAMVSRRWSPREPRNLEEWITDRFGFHLFQAFFRSYTEKVWGIPCTQIGADWAAQRIKGLNLFEAVRGALLKSHRKAIQTLAGEFLYPRLGAGQLYEKLGAITGESGGQIQLRSTVVEVRREGLRIRGVVARDEQGRQSEYESQWLLSSAPITETVLMIVPPPPREVVEACRSLRYRDHVGVHLKVQGRPIRDNWIYVHDNQVRAARISDHRNFSPAMASEEGISPITVEYFTFPHDDLASQTDEELVDLGASELERIGLVARKSLVAGCVVRSPDAYPVIEIGFQRHLAVIKAWLDQLEGFIPIGRSGMFKYNNQDHSIATGLCAARRVMGLGGHDPWLISTDAEYQESPPMP